MTIAPTLANFLTQTSYDELPEQTLTHVKMISDPAIHRLIDKIQLGSPPTENVDAYRQGTTVTINPYSGEVFTNTVHVLGALAVWVLNGRRWMRSIEL